MSVSKPKARQKLLIIFAVIVVIAVVAWQFVPDKNRLPENIATGNGYIEATQVDIATRIPGRCAAPGTIRCCRWSSAVAAAGYFHRCVRG
jgi:multidrug resistance efflux pump